MGWKNAGKKGKFASASKNGSQEIGAQKAQKGRKVNANLTDGQWQLFCFRKWFPEH